VSLSSLYVRPSVRRTGIARRTLDWVYEAAVGEGLGGIRLDTHWTWQRAARYHLHRGLWVWSWKHSIGFMRHSSLPRYEFRAGTGTLALRLAVDGRPLIRSEEAWQQAPRHSDIGTPEGLAYKIRIFERVARDHGWRVATPAIPRAGRRPPRPWRAGLPSHRGGTAGS
jgi:GNAT superfamily N-acetyltransferase